MSVNKIYKIEYRGSDKEEYSTSLTSARDYLTKKGYTQTQVLNVENNDADLWVSEGNEIFAKSEVRIIEINCIN